MLRGIFKTRKLVVISIVVGIFSGLFAVFFDKSLEFITPVFLGKIVGYMPPQPYGEGGTADFVPYMFHPFLLPLVVALGGLIVGCFTYFLVPDTAGEGTEMALKAFHYRLPLNIKTGVCKILTATTTIGSGGCAGKEGPMALAGAAVGSTVARIFKLSEHEESIILAAGLGSGIGAIFKTPFAGAIIGSELFYKWDFESEALLPGFIASVVAYTVEGLFLGFQPLFRSNVHEPTHYTLMLILGYVFLGLYGGIIARIFIFIFRRIKTFLLNLKIHPALKPAFGGFVAGCCGLLAFPSISGGYGWIQILLNNDLPSLSPFLAIKVFLTIFVVIVALSFTLGSGNGGGIFGPSFTIGSFTGASFAIAANLLTGSNTFSIPNMTIVGMISMFGAAANAPLSTIALVVEMTGGYGLLVPAIIAVPIARILVGDKSLFDHQVRTRIDSPIHIDEYKAYILQKVKVANVMTKNPITLSMDDPVSKARKIMAEKFIAGIPIVANGMIVGIVTTSDVLKVKPEDIERVKIRDVMTKNPDCVTPDTDLLSVMKMLVVKGYGRMPVINNQTERKLIGIISRSDIARFMAFAVLNK